MPTITSIEQQKKKPDRFNIYVNGQFAFAASLNTIADFNLKKNLELTQDEIDRLVKENEVGLLLDRTLRWLAVRPRSQKELADYLHKPNPQAQKPRSDFAIAQVIARVSELGYVDDTAFAKWYVESRTRSRPRGKRLLAIELRQKGIDKDIVEVVFNELFEEDAPSEVVHPIDEFQLALKAAEKQIKAYKNLPEREFIQKMGTYLGRRGFDWDTIKAVVDHYRKNE